MTQTQTHPDAQEHGSDRQNLQSALMRHGGPGPSFLFLVVTPGAQFVASLLLVERKVQSAKNL